MLVCSNVGCSGSSKATDPDVSEEVAAGCPADSELVDDVCLSEQRVSCGAVMVPGNAHLVEGEVTITFTDADGWTTPADCVWECDTGYGLVDGQCLDTQEVPCADVEAPANAHQVEGDVTITYTDADGWTEAADCAWGCDADFDLLDDACINEQYVACADIEAPANAHQVDEDVAITYTDADGWTEGVDCAWECDADFDLVDDACINEQTVDCEDIEAPSNAHQIDAEVTIAFTDAEGWATPADCGWECDADFDLLDEACISEQTVACADINPPDNSHQVDGEVTITFTDAEGWAAPAKCGWECDANFDLVDGACIAEQFVACTAIVPPANAHQVVAAVSIFFTDAGGWTEPAPCDWECDGDFDLDAESCINEQIVDCADIAAPVNAHQLDGTVTISYTDAGGWTEPAECAWECDTDFDLLADTCIDEQSVDCADIEPPANAHQVEGDVTLTYTDADGWTLPADCAWECDADFDLSADTCIDEQTVACADIAPPANAHQVEGDVAITYTDADGWTVPADCAWECDADFDLLVDDCVNEQSVDCTDITPPDNAHQVEEDVTITYTDADGWTLPAECGWECDMDFDVQAGDCIDHKFVACADIVPPANAHQIDSDVTITYTTANGWTVAADCQWDCDMGYLTDDDVACDICDNDVGYYAFGLDEDCNLSGWEDQGTAYGGGNELEMLEDGTGGAYLLWTHATLGKPDIRLQRIGPDGAVVAGWPEEGLVVCDDAASQDSGALTADGAGGVFVAWRDTRNSGISIYVQRVLSGGTIAPDWPANGLLVHEGGDYQEMRDPQLATDAAGGAYITWWGYTYNGNNGFIMVHRVAGDATWPAGWDAAKTLTPVGSVQRSFAIPDGTGGAYISWSEADCRVTRIAADGEMSPGWGGNGIVLANAGIGSYCMPPVSDGSGGVLISWYRNGGWEVGYDIFVQRVKGDKTLMWADGNPVGGVKVSGGTFHETEPAVAADGNGGAFLVWEDRREAEDFFDDSKQEIFAGHILNTGARDPAWPVYWLRLGATDIGHQRLPRIMADGTGGAYALWENTPGGPIAVPEVRLVRFAADATFVAGWAENGVVLAAEPSGSMGDWRLVSDGELGAITGWVLGAQGIQHIMATRVFGNGVAPLQ